MVEFDADTRRELQKAADALAEAVRHHRAHDESNAARHLASAVRYSPLTSSLEAAAETLGRLLERKA
ncbi:hypothetical protein SAMN05421805_12787 [Saccharopolyspora antimicrobica]|uniref:Uncharacterized protein n=1 Tax=Saccharopolyspora antimicrobica TaxID=455193 RepID=A0A1I5KNR8_9PSEU|nr:hypothetical protein [Saccharopolyspora antimicrobica]RKT85610.1 hypothetical protein ATL45_3957 [Saccharopolyspora antimicrobica]SFO86326.1 hypothetical protein SAMN05421805_12787 [Saccharopolyspora antimicrobica]